MPICQQCSTQFPIHWKNPETGKMHNLGNRKFCLTCSPFGQHNTKQLNNKIPDTHKKCAKCNEVKEVTEFYSKGGKNNTPHAYCKKCGLADVLMRQHLIKTKAVEYKGSKCQVCGYSKYTGALEFHHLDPKEKDFAISSSKVGKWDKIKAELDKCVLLCSNCHREVHANLIQL
jgi:5-methylcytosine-specific restriction endonuclease McrA